MADTTRLWERIHERLRSLEEVRTGESETGPQALPQALEARARELSHQAILPREADGRMVIIFSLGQELYAADVRHIKAVIRPALYTPVPGVPAFVAGVINHRGMMISVLDLRPFFGLQREEEANDAAILVAEAGGVIAGILAEAIEEITELPLDRQGGTPLTLTGTRQEYTTAVVPYGDRLLAALNLQAVLQDPQLVVDEEI